MDFGFGKTPTKIGNPWRGLVEHLGGGSHRITLDSNASVRTFTATDISGYALNGTWELKRPGIGSATTSPDEAALGWEWRNWAFQRSGTQGALVFFDGAGVPWQIATSSLTVNSGETVTVTLGIRPYGRLNGLTETATATVSATLSVPGITWTAGPWALMGIKRRGNVWLIGLFENWAGYPYGDHAREMKGIFEISIDGTGSFAAGSWPSGFTGFSLSASVVATTAACAPVETVTINDLTATESTPCSDPSAPATYTASTVSHYRVKVTYPVWAWYVPSGSDQMADLVKVESWFDRALDESSSISCASGTRYAYSHTSEFSVWHRVFSSAYSIDGPAYKQTKLLTDYYLTDPPDPVGVETWERVYSLGGVTFATSGYGGGGVSETAYPGASYPYLARTIPVPINATEYRIVGLGPLIKSSHVVGVLQSVSAAVTYSGGLPTTSTAALSTCTWTGFLTPGGLHASATPTAGEFTYHASSGYWQCLPAGYITAYDPVTNRHGGLLTYPAWYV